jgi:hypothetical protein
MAPKKVAKGALKRGERGNLTSPRPEIVVESVNPADLSTEEVPFDAVGSQQPVVTTATITMADFDHDDDDDDDVSPRINPSQIRTHSETMVTTRSGEVTGLMGLEASVPNIFSGQPRASTVVGTIIIRTKRRVVWVSLRLNIIAIDQRLKQQQHLHTHRLVLVYVVPVMTDSNQQPRLVLAYSRMPLANNGQQI